MTYQRTIDRRHPGCLIFLLDQSGSMAEPIGGGHASVSKAQALADIINDLLPHIIKRCVKIRTARRATTTTWASSATGMRRGPGSAAR